VKKHLLLGLFSSLLFLIPADAFAAERPNVLFIAVDDLNHWVGYTGRNKQLPTPNIDRLSAMGVSFTKAYCTAPACEPSRASLMSGKRPSTTGCYKNGDIWTKHLDPKTTLNRTFKDAGYRTMARGKIYHGHSNAKDPRFAKGWDEYDPTPKAGGGAEKYEGYFEPRPADVRAMKDKDLGDWGTIDYCLEKLAAEHEQPFFLACGLIKPHLPWAVPQKYVDQFPLEDIELPPHIDDDLADIPAAGMKMRNGDHAKFAKLKRWKHAVRSYYATVTFVDACIGRLLDGLEKSPHRDNTIIVFWGDHGWHLGEKEHWRKFSLWEEATRAPMIWVAPGVTPKGKICAQPVDFVSLYPTLCDLAGVKIPDGLDGSSFKALLENPANTEWKGVAVTTHGYKNHAVRSFDHRYIRYADGSEELYDHRVDPYEWKNLAGVDAHAALKKQLAKHLPAVNAPGRKKNTPATKKKQNSGANNKKP